jgi:hypothetical protein
MKIAALSPLAETMFRMFLVPAMAFAFVIPARGQRTPAAETGVVDDWSHHHLIFSHPGTAEEAANSDAYDRWAATVGDTRYRLQQRKRNAALGAASWVAESRLPRGLAPSALPFDDDFEDDSRSDGEPGRARRRGRRHNDFHADWSMNMGSGASAGLVVFPAKFSFSTTTANCGSATKPDFVVFNTGLAGSATQASIIAYDNLYTGCTGTVPLVYWAYNTNAGQIINSVVLSLDGSQLAFIQSDSSGVASLVVLKWAASATETAASPLTLAPVAASSYRGCAAPCMTSVTFNGSPNDSGSAPFYNYGSDSLDVGDDNGKLHKFNGVFNGTPAEAGSPWPVTVSTSALDGPVYDSVSGNIFVGDYLLNLASTCAPSGTPCGFFYSIKESTGAMVGKSNRLDFINGIVSSPVVDSSAGMAYVFVGADSHSGSVSPCGTNIPCSGVFQFPVSFTSGTGIEVTVGPGEEFLLSGSFDNTYFTSVSPASPSGHLYVVGNTGAANNTLYQITINSNVMSATATAGPVLSNSFTNGFSSAGLSITEFFTGARDYIFLSVLSFGVPAGCTDTLTSGCVMGFDVSSGTISGSTTPTGATPVAGGTSGIIIDNTASLSGASNIYYTPLANQTCTTSATTGGCAIQISQAAP